MLKVFSLCVVLLGLPELQWSSPSTVSVDFIGHHVDVNSWPEVEEHLQSLGITSPDAVTHLTFYKCDLTQLPAWVTEKMPNLTHLDIRDNAITALPENIERLTQLKHLNAPHNKITGLPPSFSQLNHLAVANFSHNNLKNLSKSSFKLPKLAHLGLSHNQIATLPDLSGLESLRILLLSHNEDILFEPDSKPLDSLEFLDLAHCNLKTVPSFLGRFSMLDSLHLEGNPLVQQGTGDKWGKNELTQKFGHRVRF